MNQPKSPPGYTLLERLGRGGAGLVYRALQANLSRPVAIKFLDPRRGPDAARFVERFRREAVAVSELNHRNIVTIHESGEHEGEPFLVMELVEGFDLQSLVDEGLPVPPEILLLLLGEIVDGLAAAHERGIIHRDIKPANLLLNRSGSVKITDFGLARSLSIEQERGGFTVPGSLPGTPAYTSPEQLLGEPMDARSDIFSLGVTAYLLLTGRLPFRGLTRVALQQEILGADPPPPDLDGPGAAEVQALLFHMLEKEPGRRPASMRALAEEIETTLDAVDPEGLLTRRRYRFLERFGRDPHGLVRSLTGLDAPARLRHSAEVADGVRPVPREARPVLQPVAAGPGAQPDRDELPDPSGIIPPPRHLDVEVVRADDLRSAGASPPPATSAARRRPAPSRPAARARRGPAPALLGAAGVAAAALLLFALRPFSTEPTAPPPDPAGGTAPVLADAASAVRAKSFLARPAPGDTVDPGRHDVDTGVLRVTVHPADPASILIEGLATGDETPARRDISAGRHLVQVTRAGWRVEKVVVLDRTAGTTRELVPSDPDRFPGVPVDVLAGHDHKVTFHLVPDGDAPAAR